MNGKIEKIFHKIIILALIPTIIIEWYLNNNIVAFHSVILLILCIEVFFEKNKSKEEK